MAFAVGSTVVADSLDDARDLCFNKGERVKVGYQYYHLISCRHMCAMHVQLHCQLLSNSGYTHGAIEYVTYLCQCWCWSSN